jgi:hypothetical protein
VSAKKLVCIVEGDGEVLAIPNLCARVLHHLERWDWQVEQDPVRQPRPSLVDERMKSPHRNCREDGLRRAVALASLRPAQAVLVLVDSDNDCPVTWAKSVAASGVKCSPVMAVREYESWLLWSLSEAERQAHSIVDPEAIRGAKERLRKIRPGYQPTTGQLALTRKIDIAALRRSSGSFDKLVRSIDALCP